MKACIAFAFFLILGVFIAPDASAQKVTKITAVTATTGTHVIEDTTGSGFYRPLIKGEVEMAITGTSTATRLTIYKKNTDKVVWSGLLSTVYVLGAPATSVAAQTISQKTTYLKTHFPK